MKHETKAARVYDWLRAYIDERKFSLDNKLPSENMLSGRLRVSRDTVRCAMKRLEEEGLIFRLKGSGTYINKAAALTRELNKAAAPVKVGLILQGQDRDANAELIRGVRSVLDSGNVELRIFFTDNKFSSERKCLNMVAHQDFDGLIIDGVKASLINPNLDCYYNLYHQKLPVVFYNNYYKDLKFPRVINNDQRCAQEMIYRMTQAGHRHIAGIFVYDNYQSTEKFQGYVRALLRFGAEFDDDYVKWCVSNEAHDLSYAKEITRFIRAIPKCTAIVCCNYMILQTVLMVLKKAGKRIPEDYSVVCFDYSGKDWEQTRITCSVSQGYDMGIRAANQLMKMLWEGADQWKAETVVVDPLIHEGSSVGRIRLQS
ncbi:MAG: substrate-binding domain-containing protein [Hungatella sp.]|jgi:GntR family transcriptional regulator of arabinose operon|nr:substrate-binding domain-containing protein [Hungatella sp.]